MFYAINRYKILYSSEEHHDLMFKPGAPASGQRLPGILKLFSCGYAYMCMCVHKCALLRPQITYGVILNLYDWLNNFCCLSVPFHGFAINVINRHGYSNKMHRQLQPMMTKVRHISCLYITFYPPFITAKMEHISFKSGCVIQLVKHIKEDWFIVLH